jgi:hypothetical protein
MRASAEPCQPQDTSARRDRSKLWASQALQEMRIAFSYLAVFGYAVLIGLLAAWSCRFIG